MDGASKLPTAKLEKEKAFVRLTILMRVFAIAVPCRACADCGASAAATLTLAA